MSAGEIASAVTVVAAVAVGLIIASPREKPDPNAPVDSVPPVEYALRPMLVAPIDQKQLEREIAPPADDDAKLDEIETRLRALQVKLDRIETKAEGKPR